LGGTIVLQSTLGEGSSFSFMLAFERADASGDKWAGGHPLLKTPSATELASKRKLSLSLHRLSDHTTPARILIVDDATINCKLLARTFVKSAKRLCITVPHVVTARNGQVAVSMVAASLSSPPDMIDPEKGEGFLRAPFNLICMDRQMPVMDGVEATIQIKALQAGHLHSTSSHATIPTGASRSDSVPKPAYMVGMSASIENTSGWLAAGVDEIIAKPFSADDIDQLLLAMYAGSPGALSLPGHVPDAVPHNPILKLSKRPRTTDSRHSEGSS
jgi:CheY-like chemotaxis protein